MLTQPQKFITTSFFIFIVTGFIAASLVVPSEGGGGEPGCPRSAGLGQMCDQGKYDENVGTIRRNVGIDKVVEYNVDTLDFSDVFQFIREMEENW